MKVFRVAMIGVLISLAVLSVACGRGAASVTTTTAFEAASATETVKPRPSVIGVTAATTGIFDSYSAIVDATIRNDGIEGVVVVVGSMTQGGEVTKRELPVYLARNATMTVTLIFPLKWRGGDWTPDVRVEVP